MPGPAAARTLTFAGNFTQTQHGAIVAGGELSVEYDLGRLTTCRDTHNGARFWSLDAYAQFQPSGQIVQRHRRRVERHRLVPDAVRHRRAGRLDAVGAVVPATPARRRAKAGTRTTATTTPSPSRRADAGDRLGQRRRRQHQPRLHARRRRSRIPSSSTSTRASAACLFADVDVWVGGVTDGSPAHPEYVGGAGRVVQGRRRAGRRMARRRRARRQQRALPLAAARTSCATWPTGRRRSTRCASPSTGARGATPRAASSGAPSRAPSRFRSRRRQRRGEVEREVAVAAEVAGVAHRRVERRKPKRA